jgi:hypothetical protein
MAIFEIEMRRRREQITQRAHRRPRSNEGDALTSSPALATVDIGLALPYDECNGDLLDAMRMGGRQGNLCGQTERQQ